AALSYSWTDDHNVSIGSSPSPSVILSLGVHAFNVSVNDTSGGNGSGMLSVNVRDTTPPAITVPSTINATADAQCNGANVSYTASANDVCAGPLPVTCSPASGSRFPLGPTTVTCNATDPSGNLGTKTFTVNVTYAFGGFLQPINPDGTSIFRLGS